MSIHKNLIKSLDDMVLWTGIPQVLMRLSDGTFRRRRLRWLPIVTLTLATIGFAMTLLYPDHFWWLGYSVFMVGMGIGNLLPLMGPVMPFGGTGNVDEREKTLRRDAYLVACATISVLAVLGLFSLVALALLRDWQRVILIRDMGFLAMYLMVLLTTLPTLYASWVLPAPVNDE